MVGVALLAGAWAASLWLVLGLCRAAAGGRRRKGRTVDPDLADHRRDADAHPIVAAVVARPRRPDLHAAQPDLGRLVQHACCLLGMQRGALAARGPSDSICKASMGDPDSSPPDGARRQAAIASLAAGLRQPVVLPGPGRCSGKTGPAGTATGMGAPIHRADEVAGALVLLDPDPGRAVQADDLPLLGDLGRLAGAALADRTKGAPPVDHVADAVHELGQLVHDLDGDLAAHGDHVLELSSAVGRWLGLEGPAMVELRLAAGFHDIGKLDLPRSLLDKPGPLTEDERDQMRQHVVLGSDALARFPGLAGVAVLVRLHHERWDGRGYPYGLAGPRIPLESRILAVCDAFAAMTSSRSYRAALAHALACAELRREAGGQFDPRVVRALLEVLSGEGAGARPGPERTGETSRRR